MDRTRKNLLSAYARVPEPAPCQAFRTIALLALTVSTAIVAAYALTENGPALSKEESERNGREYAERAWLRSQILDLAHGSDRPRAYSS